MYKQARPLRREQEHRNWEDYPQRVINYAFGAAGDIDIAAFRPTPEKILGFQQEAERLEAARLAAERAKENETAWNRLRMR
jgi:hypothetical protein